MNENFDPEFDPTLDALIAFLGSIPEPAVKMLNLPVYQRMLKACAGLQRLLAPINDSGEINLKVDRQFNFGSVSAELDDLEIHTPEQFAKVILLADNFEVYPLTNGRIRLALGFSSVLKPVL